jgi:hypothetical protein
MPSIWGDGQRNSSETQIIIQYPRWLSGRLRTLYTSPNSAVERISSPDDTLGVWHAQGVTSFDSIFSC